MGLTKDLDLIEWTSDSKLNKSKYDYSFLLQKPVYIKNKEKFKKIFINSSLSMGMDQNGCIFVWGGHQDGLLGLGFDVTYVETPTLLISNIKELSISESHAVSIDLNGEIFSWGSGKYGELCLDKRIYCPFPTKKSIDNRENKNSEKIKNKKYTKVFCSDLLTCFIDEEGKFSYFGVIIKIYKDNNSSITLKNLLKDENNSDPNFLFKEKIIYELENEKFNQISIGNGFLGLLSEKGLVYTIDHSDNITLLYTKYFVYSICVSNNQLFGLCKNTNSIQINFPNYSRLDSYNNAIEEDDNENIKLNYFICRWIPQQSEKDKISDAWNTQLFKINEEIDVENMTLLESSNKEILFIMKYVNGFSKKLTLNLNDYNDLNQSKNSINRENNNNRYDNNDMNTKSVLKDSFSLNINDNRTENFNLSGLNLKKINMENYEYNALTQIGFFDDSYNLKYKRVKNNFHGVKILSNNEKFNRSNNILRIIKNSIDEEEENKEKILIMNNKKKKLDIPKPNSKNNIHNHNNNMNPLLNSKSPNIEINNNSKNKNENSNIIFDYKIKSNYDSNPKNSNENLLNNNNNNLIFRTNSGSEKNLNDNFSTDIVNNVITTNANNFINSNKNLFEVTNQNKNKKKNFKLTTLSNYSSNDVISPSPDSLVQFYNDSCKDSKKVENFLNFKKNFNYDRENQMANLKSNDKNLNLSLDKNNINSNLNNEITENNTRNSKTGEKDKVINLICTFSDISSERNNTSPNKILNIKKFSNSSLGKKEQTKQFFPEDELNIEKDNLDSKKEKVVNIQEEFKSSYNNPYKNRINFNHKKSSSTLVKRQNIGINDNFSNGITQINENDLNGFENKGNNNLYNQNILNLENIFSHNRKKSENILNYNKGKFPNLNINDYESDFNNSLGSKPKNINLYKHSPSSQRNIQQENDDESSNKTSQEMSYKINNPPQIRSYKRKKTNLSNPNKENFMNEINKIHQKTKQEDYYFDGNNFYSEKLINDSLPKSENFNSMEYNQKSNYYNTNNVSNFANNNEYRKNRYHDKENTYVPFTKNYNSNNKNINNDFKKKQFDNDSNSDEKSRKSSMDKKIQEFKEKLGKGNNNINDYNFNVNSNLTFKSENKNNSNHKDDHINKNYSDSNKKTTFTSFNFKEEEKIVRNLNFESGIKSINTTGNKIKPQDFKEYAENLNYDNNKKNINLNLNNLKILNNQVSLRNVEEINNRNNVNNTNNSKYFTFYPEEGTLPSVQESEKLFSFDNKKINTTKNNKNLISNFNNNKTINHKVDKLNLVSNLSFNNNQVNSSNNSNRNFDENKLLSFAKGVEVLLNLFSSRYFIFIYSNLDFIKQNFLSRFKFNCHSFSNDGNSSKNIKNFSVSNSTNSMNCNQNNILKKDEKENKIIETNPENSNINKESENNKNNKNLPNQNLIINNITIKDRNNFINNENYFSFENFQVNNFKNFDLNPELNKKDMKFNTFSNKNLVIFNKLAEISDNSLNNQEYFEKKFNIKQISTENTTPVGSNKINNYALEYNKKFSGDNNNILNNEFLNFTKFFVKNIISFYKRKKQECFYEFIQKTINWCNYKVVLQTLNKRIMFKHFYTLHYFFIKFKKINNFFNGIIKLNSVYCKNLYHFFSIFGHYTRIFHIKKKYLKEFLDILDGVKITKFKRKFFLSLILNRFLSIKTPYYLKFFSSITNVINFNFRKNSFSLLKKAYFSRNLYNKNMMNFFNIIFRLTKKIKFEAFYRIKIVYIRNSYLKNFIEKKNFLNLFLLKKVLKKFIDNALLIDENLFINIKLKKIIKIYSYKIKLLTVKYLYEWKNKAGYLTKYLKNAEKPLRYNLNNEIKSMAKIQSKNNSMNILTCPSIFDNKFSNSTKFISNSLKRIVNLLTYIINKSSFEKIYFHSYGKFLPNKPKFDKSLYYINIFNANYRLKTQSISIDPIIYETQPNIQNNNYNNFPSPSNYDQNGNNLNSQPNLISLESSLESHKNKSQLTFVCNNENKTENDKYPDLQYYILKGGKNSLNSFNTLQLDSPNKKNFNLPLSLNGMNNLTTPKFIINEPSNTVKNSHRNHKYNLSGNSENNIILNKNEIKNIKNLPSKNIKNPYLSYNDFNTIKSPQSVSISNIELRNDESIKNKTLLSNNKNNSSNQNHIRKISSISNESKNGKNLNKEKNTNNPQIKNKKEISNTNTNKNNIENKSEFNKIADLFDNKTKIYFTHTSRDKDKLKINGKFYFYDSDCIKNYNDYCINRNSEFNHNKKYSYNDIKFSSPKGCYEKSKSNSISDLYDLLYKNSYKSTTSIFKEKNSMRNKIPHKSLLKYFKKKSKIDEINYNFSMKKNNQKTTRRSSSIDYNTLSPKNKNHLDNEFSSNKNYNYFSKKNYIDKNFLLANAENNFQAVYSQTVQTLNNSVNRDLLLNNCYNKNHFILLSSFFNEKVNKLKRLFFTKLVLLFENNIRRSKKYSLKILLKIMKRRIICHKLNFFTRISNFGENKIIHSEFLQENFNTARNEKRNNSTISISNHKKYNSYSNLQNKNNYTGESYNFINNHKQKKN